MGYPDVFPPSTYLPLMLRRRGTSLSSFHEQYVRGSLYNSTPPPSVPVKGHAQQLSGSYQTSSHRSLQFEVLVFSPSTMDAHERGRVPVSIPVFSMGDTVTGRVVLEPRCSQGAQLTISLEGAFLFNPPASEDDLRRGLPLPEPRKHVFFSVTNPIPISPVAENFPRSAFRDPFASMKRRPSQTSLYQTAQSQGLGDRSYPFSFELPQSARSREEIPTTFKSTSFSSQEPHRQGSYAIEYKLKVVLEQGDGAESRLNIPVVFHQDSDFLSLDGHSNEQENWLEMPLRGDRPIPFKCAATLPTSGVFSRTSSIPYFVVFTTTPRSSALAKEIAADATVSVSVLRHITILETIVFPPTPPLTPSTSSEESEPISAGGFSRSSKSRTGTFLKRVVKSPSQPLISRGLRGPDESFEPREKALPRLPASTVYSDSCNLHTAMCIGFPKRPRMQVSDDGHPSLDSHSALPDGLHKSKILLNREMLPSIDWAGLSVKYYLDVSVLVGQDELRARIPIRIT